MGLYSFNPLQPGDYLSRVQRPTLPPRQTHKLRSIKERLSRPTGSSQTEQPISCARHSPILDYRPNHSKMREPGKNPSLQRIRSVIHYATLEHAMQKLLVHHNRLENAEIRTKAP